MSGVNYSHLKHFIVRPALTLIGMDSLAAINLVTGTALAESGGQYLMQVGGGPALGLWQMEPATERDCWVNFIGYQPDLSTQIQSILAPHSVSNQRTNQLIWNLYYGAIMCRIKYYRSPLPLPTYNDANGLANYHKSVYNSALGAANAENNIPLFEEAINV